MDILFFREKYPKTILISAVTVTAYNEEVVKL